MVLERIHETARDQGYYMAIGKHSLVSAGGPRATQEVAKGPH